MARIFSYLLALATVSVSVYQTQAVPIKSRQLAGVACNNARVKTVAGLAAAKNAINNLSAAAGGDATTSSAAASAQSGLTSAGAGMQTIAGAVLAGQSAPDAASLDQVGQGLLAAQTALSGITSPSATVQPLLSAAQQQVAGAISAGNDVVSQCGGSGSTSSGNANASNSPTAPDSAAGAATVNTGGAAPAAGAAAPGAAVSGASNSGAPSSGLFGRQIGNPACNVARLQTVTRLAASSQAAQEVSSAASGDAPTVAAANNAMAALNSAKSAIGTIAAAIVAGRPAPPAAHAHVQQGLANAQTALSGITSPSGPVKSAISNAMGELTNAQTAGNAVVNNCQ